MICCYVRFHLRHDPPQRAPSSRIHTYGFINWKFDSVLACRRISDGVVKRYSSESFIFINNWDGCVKRTNWLGDEYFKEHGGKGQSRVWVSRTEQRDFDRFPS
jgi:hypothetical protein